MICDWCGHHILSYADHFDCPHHPCRLFALQAARTSNLDGNKTRSQIRTATLRDLSRTNHRDRLERDGIATYTRHDRQGRT